MLCFCKLMEKSIRIVHDCLGLYFCFSCAGQPRRHLLTTGWSAFVNKKKLVSRDAVLFLRYEDLDSIKYYLVNITGK